MIRYAFDTDIVSLLQDGNAAVVSHVGRHPPNEIATTIITVEEQLSAWYTLLRKARKPEQLLYSPGSLRVTPIAGRAKGDGGQFVLLGVEFFQITRDGRRVGMVEIEL